MAIESAIEAAPEGTTTSNSARTRLHGRMVDVHIDKENPLKSYITVEADPKNNLGQFAGTYNVSMNHDLTPAQRFQHATHAQEKGSGVCGALINDKMLRRKGRPVLLTNFRLTGDQVGTCRWIDFSRSQIHRRAALVHTAAVKSSTASNAASFPRITNITMFRHEAFDADDAEAVEKMAQLADKHFTEATRPRNYTVPTDPADPDGGSQQHLRHSMPRTAFAFVIIDDNTNEVIEYTPFLHSRRRFKDSDMPAHFTEVDIRVFKGRYPSLPYNGESIKHALERCKEYAEKSYRSGDVSPRVICLEGVRYRVSKVASSTDIQSLRSVDSLPKNIEEMSPVEMIHVANNTKYLKSARVPATGDAKQVTGDAYVRDVMFQFADNKGDTYSRFITCKTEYPALNTPWITQVSFQGKPLVVPEQMRAPIAGAIMQPERREPPLEEQAPIQHPPADTPIQEVVQQMDTAPNSVASAPSEQDGNVPENPTTPESDMIDPTLTPPQQEVQDMPRGTAKTTPPEDNSAPHAHEGEQVEQVNPDADVYHAPENFLFGQG